MLFRTILLFALTLFFAGCAAQVQQPIGPCLGKGTAEEALEALNSHSSETEPIRATGQCLLRYTAEGKQHKENFPVKLWFNPPGEIYLQGDVAFDATGLVLGANDDEFWFWLKPKEISSYWWGSWTKAGVWNEFLISPLIMLEIFGAVNEREGDWSLSRDGALDVLVLHNQQGGILKRLFIEPCNYVVSKIEYFDSNGEISTTARLGDYEQIAGRFFIPTLIRINNGGENSAEISLKSVRPTELNDKQRQRLFVRPGPDGFEHVYTIIDGNAVEQVLD